ncbi:hypothetical protein H9W95_10230 [Flavobacterium lindanitolerans]|nr:hypothetical protein [Flavobacterium lindanitolerans]
MTIAPDGTLSVNTTATGLGKTLTTDGIIQVNSANTLANSVLADAALSIANNSITTGKIADDAVTVAKIANAGNNQVLTTDGTGAPNWVNQSAPVPATTNTLVNNGTNTLTSTVNGVVASAAAVNAVITTLSGSNLTTTVNGVSSVALNLAPVVAANDKTSTVAAGTNVTVATNTTNPNNPVYTVNVPTANGANLGVVKEAGTAPTINIAADGTLSVNTTALQNNQKTSSVVAGTATTVTSATSGNNTAYTVNVSPATASATGAVKPGTGLLVAADGTLSVNTTATGLGKTLSTDGIIQVNSANTLANSVLADAALSIANNSITTAKIADDAVTVAKIANAGNNQVLTTDATGVPTWVNKNTLDNIYTADGSLAGDRTVNMNGKFLRFRSTSLPVASPETRETIFNYSNGAYITNATTTGRSNFRVSSGSSMVDLYQDLNSRAQLTSSGTSTGLLVGTANGSATPVELITNGTSRVHVSSTGKVGIGTQNMLGTTNANVLLAVNGSIETANSTYADYVFEDYFNGASELKKDYTFKSIKEVEAFINENKHLPGITSIKDLRQNDKGEYIFNMSELSIQIRKK